MPLRGGFERPKAKALGYLEATVKVRATTKATTKATATAKTEADPYGMTNKRTNKKDKQKNKQRQEQREWQLRCGVSSSSGWGCFRGSSVRTGRLRASGSDSVL